MININIVEAMQEDWGLRQQIEQEISALTIDDPEIGCYSGRRVTKMCINPNCQSSSLTCEDPECEPCYKDNHESCSFIRLGAITKKLRHKPVNSKEFMRQVHQFQNNFIDLLYLTRRQVAKKYCLNIQEKYMRQFEQTFLKKDITYLRGKDAKQFWAALQKSQTNKNNSSQKLIQEYTAAMNKSIDQMLQLKEKIFQSFLRLSNGERYQDILSKIRDKQNTNCIQQNKKIINYSSQQKKTTATTTTIASTITSASTPIKATVNQIQQKKNVAVMIPYYSNVENNIVDSLILKNPYSIGLSKLSQPILNLLPKEDNSIVVLLRCNFLREEERFLKPPYISIIVKCLEFSPSLSLFIRSLLINYFAYFPVKHFVFFFLQMFQTKERCFSDRPERHDVLVSQTLLYRKLFIKLFSIEYIPRRKLFWR